MVRISADNSTNQKSIGVYLRRDAKTQHTWGERRTGARTETGGAGDFRGDHLVRIPGTAYNR